MTNIEICEVTHDISLNDFSAMSEFKIAIARAVLEAAHPKPAAPATADDAVSDAAVLLTKYKKLCIEVGRGDSHHHARIEAAIIALRSGASAQHAEGGANEAARRQESDRLGKEKP